MLEPMQRNHKWTEMVRLSRRFRELKQESWIKVAEKGFDKLAVYLKEPIARRGLGRKTFHCQGREYPYFIHSYNATWRNERSVEIAIAMDFLFRHKTTRLLELGNVMAYYDKSSSHDVVDKYENSPGVKNIDFVDYLPAEKYDAFLAISTIEHIGWDEPEKDGTKALRAFEHIARLVKNPDNVLVTFPFGHNPFLDSLVRDRKIRFKHEAYMVRSAGNGEGWEETNLEEGLKAPFKHGTVGATGLFIGTGLP